MKRLLAGMLLLLYTICSCQVQVAIDDIETIPKISEKDQTYADVYTILDGTWKGNFIIYEDQHPKAKNKVDLKNISSDTLRKLGLKQINSIDVTQVYTSKTPYFQTVTITDTYPDTGKTVISKGVNKIQGGQMWCVVRKPDETVIHTGRTEGENTIIWGRNEDSPQRIEYFKETVSTDFYEIIGWGYYDGDDPQLSPRLWFYAKYKRE